MGEIIKVSTNAKNNIEEVSESIFKNLIISDETDEYEVAKSITFTTLPDDYKFHSNANIEYNIIDSNGEDHGFEINIRSIKEKEVEKDLETALLKKIRYIEQNIEEDSKVAHEVREVAAQAEDMFKETLILPELVKSLHL